MGMPRKGTRIDNQDSEWNTSKLGVEGSLTIAVGLQNRVLGLVVLAPGFLLPRQRERSQPRHLVSVVLFVRPLVASLQDAAAQDAEDLDFPQRGERILLRQRHGVDVNDRIFLGSHFRTTIPYSH